MKKTSIIWFIIGLTILLIYGLIDPQHFLFPKCPFLSLTGWRCPGCGSQRAMHQMLHGNIGASFHFNPLFLPVLFLAITGYSIAFFFPEKWPAIREKWFGRNTAYIALAIISVFWIGRNLV